MSDFEKFKQGLKTIVEKLEELYDPEWQQQMQQALAESDLPAELLKMFDYEVEDEAEQ